MMTGVSPGQCVPMPWQRAGRVDRRAFPFCLAACSGYDMGADEMPGALPVRFPGRGQPMAGSCRRDDVARFLAAPSFVVSSLYGLMRKYGDGGQVVRFGH